MLSQRELSTRRSLIQGEALIKGTLEFSSKFDKRVGSNTSGEDAKTSFVKVKKQKG